MHPKTWAFCYTAGLGSLGLEWGLQLCCAGKLPVDPVLLVPGPESHNKQESAEPLSIRLDQTLVLLVS